MKKLLLSVVLATTLIFSSCKFDDSDIWNKFEEMEESIRDHDKENIQFEDLQVKAICCKNWDTNNDGELSYAEAAAVTNIGTVFRENTNIIAFTELKYFTGIVEIPGSAFYKCTALWKIKIPDGVTSIGGEAFYYCSSLTSVTIGNSITSIGERAFYYCSSLTSVTIGNSVTSIRERAFEDCRSLTSVTIGNSVTSIGEYAFSFCRSLTSVYCKPTTPPTGSKYMFSDNASGRKIYVPSDSVDAYKSADGWYSYSWYIEGYDF